MQRLFLILIVSMSAVFSASAQEEVQSDTAEADSTAEVVLQDPAGMETLIPDSALQISGGASLPVITRRLPAPAGWFFFLNCLLLALLVVKFTVYQAYSRNSWRAWINENLFFQLIREKAPVNLLLVAMENLLKIYMVAAVALLALDYLSPEDIFTGRMLLRFAGTLIAFYILKNLAGYLLASLTDQVELFRVVSLNGIIATSNAAYLLIPLILIAAYLPGVLRPAGILLVIIAFSAAVILLVFRALRIFLKAHIPFNLQFFLYLCGLEILPYLFLAKILDHNIVY